MPCPVKKGCLGCQSTASPLPKLFASSKDRQRTSGLEESCSRGITTKLPAFSVAKPFPRRNGPRTYGSWVSLQCIRSSFSCCQHSFSMVIAEPTHASRKNFLRKFFMDFRPLTGVNFAVGVLPRACAFHGLPMVILASSFERQLMKRLRHDNDFQLHIT